MNEDCLKLTTYFGERSRGRGGFIADSLLGMFGAHGIATSVLLRGSEGFGLKHHLRTDQSLTLSEDPPVAAIAVDSRVRIENLLKDVLHLNPPGLLTLERARLLSGDMGNIDLPESLQESVKLTIYVGRQEQVYRVPAYIAVCDLLHRRGLAGASVLLGVDGTRHGQRQRARFFDGNSDVPMMIMSVGSGEVIARVLPELGALLRRPLATIERVRVCKRDGVLLERPHELPPTDEAGNAIWQKMMVYTSESARHKGEPIHRAVIRQLRNTTAARGATTLRGIWGFHGDHLPHGDKLFQLGRHVPVTTIIVDTPAVIAAAFEIVDQVTEEHGLVTTEMVPAAFTNSDIAHGGGPGLAHHDF